MNDNQLSKTFSLLSLVLMSLHITDDIVRGISPPGADNVGAVAIFTVWLIGTLMLAERRTGMVIMLLGGVFTAGCMLGIQKLLSFYFKSFSAQTVIYGTFAAVPVFLLWLYLSWTVILIGAYIVAELPQTE